MTYLDDEASAQESAPIEGYTFELGASTYRLTSHVEDETISGDVYTADVVSRSNAQPPFVGRAREMTISVRRDHPMALDIIGRSHLPRLARVTITRKQSRSGETLMMWRGDIQGYSTDGQYLRLRVPSEIDDQFAIHLPVYAVSRNCGNALYDDQCGVDPESDPNKYKSSTTVFGIDGTALVVTSLVDGSAVARPDHWARYGKVRRVSDGETREVVEQVGTSLTLDVPFSVLEDGDAIEVFKGCDHTPLVCSTEFSNADNPNSNIDNFYGAPDLPTRNVASPDGYGTIVQS